MTKKELKTWKDKDESKVYRLKISVPKKNKLRDVYYYTNDLFEAEYMRLEIENDILKSLEEPLRTTNKVYISN